MADFKENHYWTQVQVALVSGQWNSSSPAKAPNGSFLPWSELFRKAKKHSKSADVPEAALQAHYLSLLLTSTRSSSKELDKKGSGADNPFALGDECILPEERQEDALKAYESMQQLDSSNEYVKQITAFFAYAIGRPSECLDHVSGVSFADQLTPNLPSVLVTSADEKSEKDLLATGSSIAVEVEGKNAWVLMEALRAVCLEGMAHERVSPGSPSQALACYDKGVNLLRAFVVPKSPPPHPGRSSFESFNKYAELWSWTERLLWRNIILTAQHKEIQSILPAFRTYTTHSVHWPATFQPIHRSNICSLYLRTLILLSSQLELFQGKTHWTNEIRGVVHEYRSILGATSQFPSAGEHNMLVEEFVDFCVAAWEAGGSIAEQAPWVVEILWWATRLTFNSPRVLRHMTRLLHVSGDHTLAKRVVRLYVQVVKKARETGTMNVQGEDTQDTSAIEPDILWVATLVQGARMLCRIPGDVREAREADELIGYARERSANLNEELLAQIDLADGICKSVLAIREHEPAMRSKLLSMSVNLLMRSVERNPIPSACFHAAIVLSQPIPERDLEKAVELCRRAVEAEPKELRNWHLLGLLAAKQGEWKKAKGVLEAAIDISEDIALQSQADELLQDGIVSRDFGVSDGDLTPTSPTPHAEGSEANGNGVIDSALPLPHTLIEPNICSLPSAEELLRPIPDHPLATHRELFEHALQLRMTQIAITELVEGPESVEACWLEVFEWYSQRRDIVSHGGSARPSMDARRTPSPACIDNDTQNSVQMQTDNTDESSALSVSNDHSIDTVPSTDAITIRSPARTSVEQSPESYRSEKSKGRFSSESQQTERDKKGKRVQQMLKNQVHKQQARINTISKKIGHGVSRSSTSLHRSNSAPDLHSMLARGGPYQASSIHSRRRLSFSSRIARPERGREGSPLAPSPQPPPLPSSTQENSHNIRNARERRLLSDLWLMSAATFRRLENLDQTRGAIQEAETLDEENEAVWVQLGLYFSARGEEGKAIEAFQKALFISQDNVPATIHLCQLYLTSSLPLLRSSSYGAIDIAAGMLEAVTHGPGWDIAEAWYLLSKAYKMQGRKDRERECLMFALGLAEVRGVRDVGSAVGWCL